jgi:hypothetical protein
LLRKESGDWDLVKRASGERVEQLSVLYMLSSLQITPSEESQLGKAEPSWPRGRSATEGKCSQPIKFVDRNPLSLNSSEGRKVNNEDFR